MKTLLLSIECEESVNMDAVVKNVSKLFNPMKGIKSIALADQSMIDLQREKRLNEYFDQVEYHINCMKDKFYKIRKQMK